MTTYRVRVALRIDGAADEIDAFTDRLMDILAPSHDGDVGGSLASGDFDVWITEEAVSPTDAVLRGTAIVRAAAHAARGTTGEAWPQGIREVAVEASEVVAAVV